MELLALDRCRVCGNESGNTRFRAREMMFGTRDEFDYVACADCGCLQIATLPEDLERYYPADYYSLAQRDSDWTGLLGRLRRVRLAHLFGDRSLMGRLLVAFRGCSPDLAAIARLDVSRDASILDIGCGSGTLLRKLAAAGFTRLQGVDAFIDHDLRYPDGVTITKAGLETFGGNYDVVMMHHSLEHMSDPHAAMSAVRRLLAPNGIAVVRIPVADSTASRRYRAHWVQLDPPRHLFVHTRRSMDVLAANAGLTIVDVVYDSTAWQFWASEQYERDVPLYADPSGHRTAESRLSRREMRDFERRARELNERQLGDQACFYLRTAPDGMSDTLLVP
jgi:SAM-dependent methyltransferase